MLIFTRQALDCQRASHGGVRGPAGLVTKASQGLVSQQCAGACRPGDGQHTLLPSDMAMLTNPSYDHALFHPIPCSQHNNRSFLLPSQPQSLTLLLETSLHVKKYFAAFLPSHTRIYFLPILLVMNPFPYHSFFLNPSSASLPSHKHHL